MTPWQRGEDFDALFRRLDRNHDTHVTLEELRRAVRGVLGIEASTVSDETLVAFFEQYDTDASGAIELGELLDFVRRPSSSLSTRARSHAPAVFPREPEAAADVGRSEARPTPRHARIRRPRLPIRKLHSRLQAAAYTQHGQDMQKLFDILDKDHSGALTFDELLSAVRRELRIGRAELPDGMVREFFEDLDSDGSGEISLHELMSFVGGKGPGPRTSQVVMACIVMAYVVLAYG